MTTFAGGILADYSLLVVTAVVLSGVHLHM